jgi:phosphate starvation-inducible PhoH-like protein
MAKKSTKKETTKKAQKKTSHIDISNKTIIQDGKTIPLNNKQIAEILYGKKFNLRGKNKKQKELITEIDKNQITFAVGPAGVGKSYISVAKSLELLANPDNQYQKIYVITPAVTADEKLGFLKGSLEEKLDPFLFSTYYLMDKIIGKNNRKQLQEMRIVEPLAFAFIRGINIDSAIVIVEETQNTTKSQMKSLLTRIGYNSKFLISGDLEQTDRKGDDNGLSDGIERTKNINDIGLVEFSEKDIVRNPLISKILNNYD